MKEHIEKQAIEEMAKVIETTEQIARDAHCGLPSPRMYAKDLYWHGYRKQIEGEWEKRTFIIFDSEKIGYTCSECNTTWETPTNYCPNCGAKMKGGAE